MGESKTICIDFDGVIRKNHDSIILEWDEFFQGAIDFIQEKNRAGDTVFIFTARKGMDLDSVAEYMLGKCDTDIAFMVIECMRFDKAKTLLERFGNPVGITNIKFPADIYIDDHAYRFEGDWTKAREDIEKIIS